MVVSTEEVMEPGAAGTEGFGWDVQQLADYFYADGGVLALTRETCLQQDFDTLMRLFCRVVLHTTVANTARMSCQPCCTLGVHSVEAYGLWIMG